MEEDADAGNAASEAIVGFREHLKSKGERWLEISSAHRKGLSELLDEVVTILAATAGKKEDS